MVIMMKMGCFLVNEARIIRLLPSTDGRRGCVGNSAVPLSSAALKQPASPEVDFVWRKERQTEGWAELIPGPLCAMIPFMEIDSPWRTRSIGEAQEQGYAPAGDLPEMRTHRRCPVAAVAGSEGHEPEHHSATFPCGANGAGTRRRLLACVNSALPES